MNNGNNGSANAASEKLGALKDKVRGLVDQGEEKVDALKHKAMDVKDQAVAKGNVILDRAETFIKANPLKAVGLAFGIGYIGMRLFRR